MVPRRSPSRASATSPAAHQRLRRPARQELAPAQGPCAGEAGIDLAAAAQPSFGAPPLHGEKLEGGEFDAALLFWNFCARLEAKGYRKLLGAGDIARAVRASGEITLLGYISTSLPPSASPPSTVSRPPRGGEAHPRRGRRRLDGDPPADGSGGRRDLSDARRYFLDGEPSRPVAAERADAETLYAVLRTLGGEKLVGSGTGLPAGLYWERGAVPDEAERHAVPVGVAQILSLLLLVALWQGVALVAASKLLPGPLEVFAFIAREAMSGELLHQIGATLRRVTVAFILAMAIGGALGVALGRLPAADRLLDSWVLVLLNTPALVVIVLCYVWLGLSEAAAVLAVTLNKIPNVAVIMREGARTLDPQIEEMRPRFRFGRGTWIRHVMVPQLEPYTVAAARSGLALVWKIVLVVELLGRPDGVGYAISYYFQLFDVAGILGFSTFTVVMLVIEYALLQPLEAHAGRWRPAAA